MAVVENPNWGLDEPPLTVTRELVRSFSVSLKTDNIAQDIQTVDVLQKLRVIDTVKCCQRTQRNAFDITFRTRESKETFLESFEAIHIGENTLHSIQSPNLTWERLAPNIRITIFGLPCEIDDSAISQKLAKYCDVDKVSRSRYRNFPSVESGVRVVETKIIKTPIPNRLYIRGQRVNLKYQGQPSGKKCYNCGKYGHLIAECPDMEENINVDICEDTNVKTIGMPDTNEHGDKDEHGDNDEHGTAIVRQLRADMEISESEADDADDEESDEYGKETEKDE